MLSNQQNIGSARKQLSAQRSVFLCAAELAKVSFL